MLEVCVAFHALQFLQTIHLLCLMVLPLALSVPILFALVEHARLEQIDFGTPIHASFTEVSLFHTFVLDERSSEGPSTHLSWTDVVATAGPFLTPVSGLLE